MEDTKQDNLDEKEQCSDSDKECFETQKEEVNENSNNLQEEYDALKDNYLRTVAEFENFKKRTLKEKEQIRSKAISYTLSNLVDVFDNLERASLIDSEDLELKKGIDLTITQYKKSLEKLKIEEINPVGEVFNPSFHNAVIHVEDDSCGKNEVCEVLQKGYKVGDEVIRFAMVKVAN